MTRLTGPDPEIHLRKLSSDSLNLRYALEWAAERPGGAGPGLELVAGLERYWEICGNLEEARRLSKPGSMTNASAPTGKPAATSAPRPRSNSPSRDRAVQ